MGYGEHALGNKALGGGSAAVGTTGVLVPEFQPPVNPSFPVSPTLERSVNTLRFIGGSEQVIPRALRATTPIPVTWPALTQRQIDEILSFFDQFEGAGGPFTWAGLWKVRSPLGVAPTLDQVAGGSLSSRTYKVRYTWYSNEFGGETEPSKEATLAVDASKLLVVSVHAFPIGVDRVRIYASETTPTLEATIQATEWTEPTTGLVGGGAALPSANTLKPLIRYVLVGNPRLTLVGAAKWSLSITLLMQKIEA